MHSLSTRYPSTTSHVASLCFLFTDVNSGANYFFTNNKQIRHYALKDSSLEEKLSKVRGIIFDIDGTIADSWKLGFDATQVMLEKNGMHTITEEIYS